MQALAVRVDRAALGAGARLDEGELLRAAGVNRLRIDLAGEEAFRVARVSLVREGVVAIELDEIALGVLLEDARARAAAGIDGHEEVILTLHDELAVGRAGDLTVAMTRVARVGDRVIAEEDLALELAALGALAGRADGPHVVLAIELRLLVGGAGDVAFGLATVAGEGESGVA